MSNQFPCQLIDEYLPDKFPNKCGSADVGIWDILLLQIFWFISVIFFLCLLIFVCYCYSVFIYTCAINLKLLKCTILVNVDTSFSQIALDHTFQYNFDILHKRTQNHSILCRILHIDTYYKWS